MLWLPKTVISPLSSDTCTKFTVTPITSHPRLALVFRTLGLLYEQSRYAGVLDRTQKLHLFGIGIYLLLRCTKQTEFSCVNPISFPLIHLSSLIRVLCAWGRCPKFPRLSTWLQFLLYLCLYNPTSLKNDIFQFRKPQVEWLVSRAIIWKIWKSEANTIPLTTPLFFCQNSE